MKVVARVSGAFSTPIRAAGVSGGRRRTRIELKLYIARSPYFGRLLAPSTYVTEISWFPVVQNTMYASTIGAASVARWQL
jgi:hypothetical protein